MVARELGAAGVVWTKSLIRPAPRQSSGAWFPDPSVKKPEGVGDDGVDQVGDAANASRCPACSISGNTSSSPANLRVVRSQHAGDILRRVDDADDLHLVRFDAVEGDIVSSDHEYPDIRPDIIASRAQIRRPSERVAAIDNRFDKGFCGVRVVFGDVLSNFAEILLGGDGKPEPMHASLVGRIGLRGPLSAARKRLRHRRVRPALPPPAPL